MARTKKCVKDADTGKCRKAIKSGRPRCSGKKPDCFEDSNGKCKKSRKPGRPRVKSTTKRKYKKQSRKKRSDAGKPRGKRNPELFSFDDYEKYIKVASDKNLLKNLLDQTAEMVANDETLKG